MDTVIVSSVLQMPSMWRRYEKLVPNKAFEDITEKFQQQKDMKESKVTVVDILEQFHSGNVELNQVFLDQLASMIAKRKREEKICSIHCEHLFLSNLLKQKVNDIELLKMQIEMIKKDVTDVEIKMKGDDPTVNSQLRSFMQSNFNQIRESYIEISMPDSITSTSSCDKVEKWRNCFSDLTKYTSFDILASSYINDI